MDDAAWRVRLEFASLADEKLFLEWWADTTEAGAYADPSGNGPLTFFYLPDREQAEALALALRRELPRLPVDPVKVAVDQWLPDEARWSAELATPVTEESEEERALRGARDEVRWEVREWSLKDSVRDSERPGGWLEDALNALFRAPWP